MRVSVRLLRREVLVNGVVVLNNSTMEEEDVGAVGDEKALPVLREKEERRVRAPRFLGWAERERSS